MPNVVNVLDHWIELYSSDRDEVATADYLFWFGYESPPDILITTALSALTLGVDIERGAVGTVGVRVHRYVWLGKNGQIRYKQLPPSHDWNSERISRCVSVEVRNSVFYANATSLSTVYVFDDDGPATAKWAATAQFKARRIIGYEASTGRVAHSLDVLGDPAGLAEDWPKIEQQARQRAAELAGSPLEAIELLEVEPRGLAGAGTVDLERQRLIRPRRVALGGLTRSTAAVRPRRSATD